MPVRYLSGDSLPIYLLPKMARSGRRPGPTCRREFGARDEDQLANHPSRSSKLSRQRQEVYATIWLRMLIPSSLSRARRSGESKESGDAVLIRHRRPARRSWKSRPKTPQLVAPAPSTSLWGHVRHFSSSPSATTTSYLPTLLRRSANACRSAGGAPRCSRSAARPPTRQASGL